MAHLIIICGVPGAGKSTLVRYLSDNIFHHKTVTTLDPDMISLSDSAFLSIANELNIPIEFLNNNFDSNFTGYTVNDYLIHISLINKYIENKIINSLKDNNIVILSRPMSNKDNFYNLLQLLSEHVPSVTIDILQLQVSYRVAAKRVKKRVAEGKHPLFYVPLKYYYRKCKEVDKFLSDNINVKKLYRNYWTAETYKNKSYNQLIDLLRDHVLLEKTEHGNDEYKSDIYSNSNLSGRNY